MTFQFRDTHGAKSVSVGRRSIARSSRLYRRYGKRAFDLSFVIMSAPAAVMLTAVGVVLALLGGVRPFYLQERVGKGGKVFRIVKIRTMVEDADQVLESYLAENAEARAEWDERQKLREDPRITRFGRILRSSSLDEIPQLWNVFKGDMSIVGPRPIMVQQKALYEQSDLRNGSAYYSLRPGITGPWQISDRSVGTFAGRVDFDTTYRRKLSFTEDMRILLKTAGAVLKLTGK